jgi:NhaP-type Na+/H+ and K+/H+ antiporter
MNSKWNFSLFKVILIFCCGIVLGSDIILLSMKDVSKIGAWCGIIAMLLVATSVLMGARIKEQKK